MKLQREIERRVREKRPHLDWASGQDLFADLMSRIANDVPQRSGRNADGTAQYDFGDDDGRASRYQRDHESTRAQKFLLRCLEAVTR